MTEIEMMRESGKRRSKKYYRQLEYSCPGLRWKSRDVKRYTRQMIREVEFGDPTMSQIRRYARQAGLTYSASVIPE